MKNQNGTKKSTESLFCRSRRDVMCWKIFYDEKGKRQKQKFSRLMGSNNKKKNVFNIKVLTFILKRHI